MMRMSVVLPDCVGPTKSLCWPWVDSLACCVIHGPHGTTGGTSCLGRCGIGRDRSPHCNNAGEHRRQFRTDEVVVH